jgi:hypothetical protein
MSVLVPVLLWTTVHLSLRFWNFLGSLLQPFDWIKKTFFEKPEPEAWATRHKRQQQIHHFCPAWFLSEVNLDNSANNMRPLMFPCLILLRCRISSSACNFDVFQKIVVQDACLQTRGLILLLARALCLCKSIHQYLGDWYWITMSFSCHYHPKIFVT